MGTVHQLVMASEREQPHGETNKPEPEPCDGERASMVHEVPVNIEAVAEESDTAVRVRSRTFYYPHSPLVERFIRSQAIRRQSLKRCRWARPRPPRQSDE
jgi:hypothetical protein